MLLDTYYDGEAEQLVPLALELKNEDVTPDFERDGDEQELGYPELDDRPAARDLCDRLNRRIDTAEDGHVLLEAYWLALAYVLHRELGMPVLAADCEMPIAEQLERQRGRTQPADPLAGLDVFLTWPIDEHRIAAVWRSDWGHQASARAPLEPIEIGFNTEIGRNPEVRAGWLPPGAVGAQLRDRAGVWHEARADHQVWLCVLPQRAGQRDPAIRYLELGGAIFQRLEHPDALPALWPAQAPGPPELSQSTDGVLAYTAEDWYVVTQSHTGIETHAAFRPLTGTILGQPYAFGLENTDDGRWRAVAVCASFTVDVEAGGRPPERLDLVAIDSPPAGQPAH
ncbi:hypothetical protein DVA67_031610 [Solirubrobacter sp. CPCC 204708]|nr:hypothetical protein [Solirubrobacter deserti]